MKKPAIILCSCSPNHQANPNPAKSKMSEMPIIENNPTMLTDAPIDACSTILIVIRLRYASTRSPPISTHRSFPFSSVPSINFHFKQFLYVQKFLHCTHLLLSSSIHL